MITISQLIIELQKFQREYEHTKELNKAYLDTICIIETIVDQNQTVDAKVIGSTIDKLWKEVGF
jgi:hypothetical protein